MPKLTEKQLRDAREVERIGVLETVPFWRFLITNLELKLITNAERSRRIFGDLRGQLPIDERLTDAEKSAIAAASGELELIFKDMAEAYPKGDALLQAVDDWIDNMRAARLIARDREANHLRRTDGRRPRRTRRR